MKHSELIENAHYYFFPFFLKINRADQKHNKTNLIFTTYTTNENRQVPTIEEKKNENPQPQRGYIFNFKKITELELFYLFNS